MRTLGTPSTVKFTPLIQKLGPKQIMSDNSDFHFKTFAKVLEKHIKRYGTIGDFYEHQRKQLVSLIALELEFRDTIQAHKHGLATYQYFVDFIYEELRNILSSRPYFRERQGTFTARISDQLKAKSAVGLYPFRLNYPSVSLMYHSRKWGTNSKIERLYKQIDALRTELIETNMPLAISRARVFYSRTPKSHLTYMDLIQIASEGLMSGINKYTPAEETGVAPGVFRSTVMGRISGYHIDFYSETFLHFYPNDRRKLYRANKASRTCQGGLDFEKIATAVNLDVTDRQFRTNAGEIAEIMSASSCLSLDQKPTNTDAEPNEKLAGQWDVAPEDVRPDLTVENHQALTSLAQAISQLSVFEKKVLRMKGVSF
jgi:DNA-directed RNA polymerase specialized sigma subunit